MWGCSTLRRISNNPWAPKWTTRWTDKHCYHSHCCRGRSGAPPCHLRPPSSLRLLLPVSYCYHVAVTEMASCWIRPPFSMCMRKSVCVRMWYSIWCFLKQWFLCLSFPSLFLFLPSPSHHSSLSIADFPQLWYNRSMCRWICLSPTKFKMSISSSLSLPFLLWLFSDLLPVLVSNVVFGCLYPNIWFVHLNVIFDLHACPNVMFACSSPELFSWPTPQMS